MDCSVVIPHKDRIEMLGWTLRALRKQVTKRSFEVVVVDDGSETNPSEQLTTDDLPENITFIRQTNRGSAISRNVGWREAKGKIIIFLDCDQITNEDFVENHCRGFDQSDLPFLQLGTRQFLTPVGGFELDQMQEAKRFRDERFEFFMKTSFNLTNISFAWHLCFSHNMSMYRDSLVKFGGFDEGFRGWGFEDCELGYRMRENGVTPVFNPLIGAYHQYHNQRMTKDKFQLWMDNLRYFQAKYPTAEVDIQNVLIPLNDPALPKKKSWTRALMQIEGMLRLAEGRPLRTVARYEKTCSSLDDLRILAENANVADTLALVAHDDLDMIINMQLDPSLREVRLFLT